MFLILLICLWLAWMCTYILINTEWAHWNFAWGFPFVFDVYPITWGCVSACVYTRWPKSQIQWEEFVFFSSTSCQTTITLCFLKYRLHASVLLTAIFPEHRLTWVVYVYVAVQTCTDKHMMKVTNQSIQNHTTQLNSFWQATHKSREQTMLFQWWERLPDKKLGMQKHWVKILTK